MTIKECNELIARFMGATPVNESFLSAYLTYQELMPVVDKIESLEDSRFDVYISQSECRIFDSSHMEDILSENKSSKLSSIRFAVINFIRYYES